MSEIKRVKATKEEIIQCALDGLCVREIMNKYGYKDRKYIRELLRKNNIVPAKPITTQFNNPFDYVQRNQPNFEYVKDYVNCDTYMTIRHKSCGYEFEISGITIRHRKCKLKCPKCSPIEIEQRRKEKAEERKRQREEYKQKQKELLTVDGVRIRKHSKKPQQKSFFFNECKCCGSLFLATAAKKTYCSLSCQKRIVNRYLDNRIKKEQIKDKDITLEKLFIRDSGVCYLCGGLCDWYDYQKTDLAFVAGDYYPSIEHIKPISKGGLHSWDNIKLAHRICNTKKSAKDLKEYLIERESVRKIE